MTYKLLRKFSKSLILAAAIIALAGCANFSEISNEQAQANEQPQVDKANIADDKNDSTSQEQSAESELDAEAIEAQQIRASVLALINAPDRFLLYNKDNSGKPAIVSSSLARALSAYRNQQLQQALNYLEEAKADPTPLSSGAYVLSGDIYLALAEQQAELNDMAPAISNPLEAAKQSFNNALSLNPYNYKAANRLALLYREQGDFDKAKGLYTQAIEAYPGHAVSYRNRGILLDLYLGDKVSALEDYKRYLSIIEFQLDFVQNKSPAAATTTTSDATALPPAEQGQVSSIAPGRVAQFLPPAELKRQIRQIKGWIVDLERQLRASGLSRRLPLMNKELHHHVLLAKSRTMKAVGEPHEY